MRDPDDWPEEPDTDVCVYCGAWDYEPHEPDCPLVDMPQLEDDELGDIEWDEDL